MSTIPGNPYAKASGVSSKLSEQDGDWAVAQSSMVIAYEQRTANLITYWNALAGDAAPWQDTPFQRELDGIHRDIRTRLGRTPEVPK